MKANPIFISITTYKPIRKRKLMWLPKVYRFKTVTDDYKREYYSYEFTWLHLAIILHLEHKSWEISPNPFIEKTKDES